MAIASISTISNATIAKVANFAAPALAPVRPPAIPFAPLAPTAIAAPAVGSLSAQSFAVPFAGAGSPTSSAPVRLSPLGEVAGAVGRLGSTLGSIQGSAARAIADPDIAAANATRIAQAIALLDQSIFNLARIDDAGGESLDFLSSAEFSQRLLASSLTDTINGRATATSLAAIGLSPRADGGFSVDPAALEQSFRLDPAGVLALVTDYARNLDGFFAQQGGLNLDLSALIGPGTASGRGQDSGSPLASLGDFGTRQALAAYRANSLL